MFLINACLCLICRTLGFLRGVVASLCTCLTSIFSTSYSHLGTMDSSPFDPTQPSIPISYPLKTLQELESRSYFDSFHYHFNRASVCLQSGSEPVLPDRPRILVCHDMAGGYVDDKWVQGGNNEGAYAIWHWYLMDVFVYFSHNLVTLPPPCWTNAGHKHGVKVLGTFITEWDEGIIICNTLLSTKASSQMYAERLSELAVALGFDGWLINMEVKLDPQQISNLKVFVNHLTQTMHSSKPGSLVIWYDSVIIDGNLQWQNQLNEKNKPFFNLCDGIFINYTWKKNYPKRSVDIAGDRRFDVYMGIDVFGRGTYGDGQWQTNVALDVLKRDDVSAAIFAPGWVYQSKQPPDFQTAQNHWWSLVERSWGILQNYPKVLPFHSNFDQGHGYHFSVDGGQVSNVAWNNISCQGFQPLLQFSGESNTGTIQVLSDSKEPSYGGGGNVIFKGTLESNSHFSTRLFQGKLLLEEPVHFIYSVKLKAGSLLGLPLEFSSTTNEKISVLLVSTGNTLLAMNQFSSKFDKVIIPHRVTNTDAAAGWIILESTIAMSGYTLTEIRAACYNTPESKFSADSFQRSVPSSEYHAILGHITIKTSDENSDFPPSSSWIVGGQDLKWSSNLEGKALSLKILWELKEGDDSPFSNYNIYVQKLAECPAGEAPEFIGVAQVGAFYVFELSIPSGISTIKFIIQVIKVDGASQRLDDSPSLQIDVQS